MKRPLALLALLLCTPSITSTQKSLDEIALKYGTDKSSSWHHYTRIYDGYFSHLRDEKIKFFEIGFWHGASIRMWKDYFPKAELYSIDISQKLFTDYAKDLTDRCHFAVVDQEKEPALRAFVEKNGGEFDIIVDDGGHDVRQQIKSFQVLFPYVKAGGIYVIEDLATSFSRGEKTAPPQKFTALPNSAVRFLWTLVDSLNYSGARTLCHDKDKCPEHIQKALTYHQKHIQSVHFYDGVCFVFKRDAIGIPTKTYVNPWKKNPCPRVKGR